MHSQSLLLYVTFHFFFDLDARNPPGECREAHPFAVRFHFFFDLNARKQLRSISILLLFYDGLMTFFLSFLFLSYGVVTTMRASIRGLKR